MREAIGSSLIFNLVITFVILLTTILIGSFAYSKAYKAKNIILNAIVKNDGWNDITLSESSASLSEMGYSLNRYKCKPVTNEYTELVYGSSMHDSYNFCIYEINIDKGTYYRVVTYMHFDFPIIGNFIELPVQGETKIIKYNFENVEG